MVPCNMVQTQHKTGFMQSKSVKPNPPRNRQPTAKDLKKLHMCVVIKHPGSKDNDTGAGETS